jgi:hypothetical protein
MKSKTWLILLAFTAVMLLAYSVSLTGGYFSDRAVSTDNVLRVNTSLLWSADKFAVLAYSTVTNTGPSVITGDVGVSPGTSVVGFPDGVVNGTIYTAGATAAQAQLDLTTAYNDAAGRTPSTTITGNTLGGLNLGPGVYHGGALSLTGILTLTGNADDIWIFQAASTLDTASGSHITFSGGARAANVYWQVGSSATLGANSLFEGNIMAYASITMYAGATLEGRALAQTGAITLNSNIVTRPGS